MPQIKDRYSIDPYSKIPDVWILDSNFQKLGLIDDYTSLIWSRRYYEVGDFELYVRVTDKNMNLLNVDLSSVARFIMRNDTKEVMRIEKIEISTDAEEGDFITASGRDLRCLLYQRVTNEEIILGETLASPVTGGTLNSDTVKITEAIYTMVNYNLYNPSDSKRKIPRFTVQTNTIDVGTSAMKIDVGENVGEKVEELCNDFRIGWKAEWNGSQIVFTCYEGADRTSEVIFSEEFSNLIKFTNTENLEDFYNTMILFNEYTDEDGNEIESAPVTFGDESGMTRFEKSFSGSEDLDVPTTTTLRDLMWNYKIPKSYKMTYQYYEYDHTSGSSDSSNDYYRAVNGGSDTPNPRDTYENEAGEEVGRTGNDYMSDDGLIIITSVSFDETGFLGNDNWFVTVKFKYYDFYIYSEEWLANLKAYFTNPDGTEGGSVTEDGLYYRVYDLPIGSGHIREKDNPISAQGNIGVKKWQWNLVVPAEYSETGEEITTFKLLKGCGTEEDREPAGYPADEYPEQTLGYTTNPHILLDEYTLPISFDLELTDILIQDRYMAKAYSMVEEALSTNEFEGEIAPDVNYTYREDYDVGDKIRIKTDIGIQKDVRILEAVETFDSDGYNIEVKFGV